MKTIHKIFGLIALLVFSLKITAADKKDQLDSQVEELLAAGVPLEDILSQHGIEKAFIKKKQLLSPQSGRENAMMPFSLMTSEDYIDALFRAARHNSTLAIDFVIQAIAKRNGSLNAQLKALTPDGLGEVIGDTPLIIAARNGYVEIVEKLLAAGADITCRNSHEENVEKVALSHPDVQKLLEKMSESKLKRREAQQTQQHEAQKEVEKKVDASHEIDPIQMLKDAGFSDEEIEASAQAEQENHKKKRAQSHKEGRNSVSGKFGSQYISFDSSEYTFAQIVELTKEAFSRWNSLSQIETNPSVANQELFAFICSHEFNHIKTLVALDKQEKYKVFNKMFNAVRNNNSKELAEIINIIKENAADKNDPFQFNNDCNAVAWTVDAFLEDVHYENNECRLDTALIMACRNGFVECARLLIEAGAEIDYAQNEQGETPEMVATPAIKELLDSYLETDSDADTTVADSPGNVKDESRSNSQAVKHKEILEGWLHNVTVIAQKKYPQERDIHFYSRNSQQAMDCYARAKKDAERFTDVRDDLKNSILGQMKEKVMSLLQAQLNASLIQTYNEYVSENKLRRYEAFSKDEMLERFELTLQTIINFTSSDEINKNEALRNSIIDQISKSLVIISRDHVEIEKLCLILKQYHFNFDCLLNSRFISSLLRCDQIEGFYKFCSLLPFSGFDPNKNLGFGDRIIHLLAKQRFSKESMRNIQDFKKSIDTLVLMGADLNMVGANEKTPLASALYFGNLEIARCLMHHKANPFIGKDDHNPMTILKKKIARNPYNEELQSFKQELQAYMKDYQEYRKKQIQEIDSIQSSTNLPKDCCGVVVDYLNGPQIQEL